MKTALITALASLALAFAAHAAEQRPIAKAAQSGCVTTGLSHVAYVPAISCCADQLRCTQFLSTTMIELPRLSPRT